MRCLGLSRSILHCLLYPTQDTEKAILKGRSNHVMVQPLCGGLTLELSQTK